MGQKRDGSRGLTATALSHLLGRLDPEPERAGILYEELHRTLVKFFDWRGAWFPEEGADVTLDRLARKLEEGQPVEDVRTYAHGIARLVLLEQWRRPAPQLTREAEGELAELPAPEEEDEEPLDCLQRCLAELPAESRELILRYYLAEGREKIDNRRRLAGSLGLTESALRSRAQRIRDRLERCIAACVGHRGAMADTKT